MDDDSGMGCLVGGLFILVLIGLVIQAIIYILTAVVTALVTVIVALSVVVGIALAGLTLISLFVAAGIGSNLLVRAILGKLNRAYELTSLSLRVGLAIVYGVPVVFLIASHVLVPAAQSGMLLWVWGGFFALSTPAYYWTWWSGRIATHRIRLGEPVKIDIRIPEIQFTVPFTLDAALQAEEAVVRAEAIAWLAMVRFEAKVWLLETKIKIEHWCREFRRRENMGRWGDAVAGEVVGIISLILLVSVIAFAVLGGLAIWGLAGLVLGGGGIAGYRYYKKKELGLWDEKMDATGLGIYEPGGTLLGEEIEWE